MDDKTPEQESSESPRTSPRLSGKRKNEAADKKGKKKKKKTAEGESNDNEKASKKAPDMNELGMVIYNVLVGAVPTKKVLRMTDIALPMIFLFIMSRLHALEQSLSSVVRMHPAAPSDGDKILAEFFTRKKGRPATNKKVSRPPKMVKFMSFERTDQESDEDEETKEEAKEEAKASTAKTPPKNNRVSSEAEKGNGKGGDDAALPTDQDLSPTSVTQPDVQKAKQTAVQSTIAAPVAAAPAPAVVIPAQASVQAAAASAQVPVAPFNVASQISQIGSLFATPEQLQQVQSLMAMMQMFTNNANNGANNGKPGSPN